MTVRSTVKSVSFMHPFRLVGIGDEQPAGTYDVTTDEERIEGANARGWRRTATTMLVSRRGITRSFTIDPVELEASLMRDVGSIVIATARS